MEILRLFGYQPEVPGESLVFVTCELTVTDSRGYTLEQTSPGKETECHRYNARGDEVVSEKRSGGPGCGWMVTVHTPHETTESKYEYDAQGNWVRRFDVITSAQFPRSSHEVSFPLTEILEHRRYRQTFERAITYFPEQP
jgi:YD repeat-containing protein